MVDFAIEKLDQVFDEFANLRMVDHWQECADHKDVIPLAPDYDAFKAAEINGLLLIVTARHEGKLIGYWAGFVRRHLHYKTTMTAHTDIYYIAPEFRAKCARGLFRFLHKELRARKVVRVFNRSKLEDVNGAGRFLEAIGYELMEYGYSYLLETQ